MLVMVEEWADIKGFEGLYQVSNLGRVKSLEREIGHRYKGRTRTISERIIGGHDNGHGYKCVHLEKDKKRHVKYIHRLVAEAFLVCDGGRTYVNHKDHNMANNRADNLEWCTQKENVDYSRGRMKHTKRSKKSATGYKYIYKDNKSVRGFKVCIRQFNVYKHFTDIEKAIAYRDEVINAHKEYFLQ